MHISYSRFSTYLGCPYCHYLAYVEGWTKKKTERPLFFGSDFHKLLEYRIHPDKIDEIKEQIRDTYYSLTGEQQADLGGDYLEDLFTIFDDYQDVWKDAPLPTMTEQEFNIPIAKYKGEDIIFKGIIDELYFNPDESISVGEHKTFSKMPNKDFLVMNTQKSLYAKAVEILYGELPKTIRWDYIRSKPADYPVWLEKSNRFSTSASQNITPYSWRRACQERGITDEETLNSGDKYSQNIPNFFFRTEMDYIPEMIDDIWDGFVYTVKDIVIRGTKNKTKNVSQGCSWCGYRDICHAELTGGNVEAILEHDFKRRDDCECSQQKETN